MNIATEPKVDRLRAMIMFLLRRSGWGWWLAIGMQVGIFALAEIEAQVIDPNSPGWSSFSRFPLLALFLLFAIQAAQGRLSFPTCWNLKDSNQRTSIRP